MNIGIPVELINTFEEVFTKNPMVRNIGWIHQRTDTTTGVVGQPYFTTEENSEYDQPSDVEDLRYSHHQFLRFLEDGRSDPNDAPLNDIESCDRLCKLLAESNLRSTIFDIQSISHIVVQHDCTYTIFYWHKDFF